MPGPTTQRGCGPIVILAGTTHLAIVPLESPVAIGGKHEPRIAAAVPVLVAEQGGIARPGVEANPERHRKAHIGAQIKNRVGITLLPKIGIGKVQEIELRFTFGNERRVLVGPELQGPAAEATGSFGVSSSLQGGNDISGGVGDAAVKGQMDYESLLEGPCSGVPCQTKTEGAGKEAGFTECWGFHDWRESSPVGLLGFVYEGGKGY